MTKILNIFERLRAALDRRPIPTRVALACIAVLLGYVFIEGTWNTQAYSMEMRYLAPNLLFLAFIYCVLYFWGQQSRLTVALFWTICLVMGIADYFLVQFKGQPVVPADILAIQTALDVKEGYDLYLSTPLIQSISFYVLSLGALCFVPKIQLNRKLTGINIGLALVLTAGSVLYIDEGDIQKDFDCVVGQWNTLWYFENQGTTLCFLKRVQDFFPDPPDDYSSSAAEAILSASASSSNSDDATIDSEDLPNIIVVMNESFADVSTLPLVDSNVELLSQYYYYAEQSVQSGIAYASVFGSGTCNSEFEVITGSAMTNLGDNVYPYVMYDLSSNENLVTYLEGLGYESLAMHPAEAKNWRRDRVYEALGFDAFFDITDFEDSEKLRWYTTDIETYTRSIEAIANAEAPQFILDITMQNHGGYTSGLLQDISCIDITANGSSYLALSEYTTCAERSDCDLGLFLSQLDELDEKVIVLFFGDHQPSLTDVPAEEVYGKATEDMNLEELQQMYGVPYLIWANYETAAGIGTKLDTSLNYLGANLINAAGLPLSPYLSFLESAQAVVPALNQNGYMSADGIWHAYPTGNADDTLSSDQNAEDTGDALLIADALQVVSNYAIVQYANLFDAQSVADLLSL